MSAATNRKILAIIVLGVILLACVLSCGYFGLRAIQINRLRNAAMTAYEKKDYEQAERLLLQYVKKDPNGEAEFAALANIYHESGDIGKETMMWQTASSLNPLNQDYREKLLSSAIKSANYDLLHGLLGRKAKVNAQFTDEELYLFVISSYRSGYRNDGEDAYKQYADIDPEAFHRSELGRLAEFMVLYPKMTEGERDNYLNQAMLSEDPVIRFEALYTIIRRAEQQADGNERLENMLQQAVEINDYVGTPILANYYFLKCRFDDVIDVSKPYLKKIDDANLYVLYAESCTFTGKMDELKVLEQKLRRKSGVLLHVADYCKALIAYLENDEKAIAEAVRKSGKNVYSPLSRLINLRVAITNGSVSEILTAMREFFSAEPFHDLHKRAVVACLEYLSNEMQKPDNQDDPSQMADLARILSGYLQGNRLLTEIILTDQYKKDVLKEADLLAAMDQFPDDLQLMRVAAEYLILHGKPEQALSIIEQILAIGKAAEQAPDRGIRFLHMLALEQLERYEEAAAIFREVVERSDFDLNLLRQYFQFCEKNKRENDLQSMADKLDTVKDGTLNNLGKIFRAASWLVTNDSDRRKEALDMLVSTPTDDPDFTFYAATRLYQYDRLDEAEAKYKAVLKTYRTPALPYANLSLIYHTRGEEQKALEFAKEAFEREKKSMLSAFIYAQRLFEAGRYEEAVDVLKFPRHAVNYRADLVGLWTDCMKKVIEKSMADRRYLQAEEQCKHLLIIAPDDEFGKEKMKEIREILFPKKDENAADDADATAA